MNVPQFLTLPRLGAHLDEQTGRCTFTVWAPLHDKLGVTLHDGSGGARTTVLERDPDGYHSATVDGVSAGERYTFSAPGGPALPDPASRWQPDDVHGPSAIVSSHFPWRTAQWRQPDLRELVLYELHVGTFTDEGTFDAIIPRLQALKQLGVNALELLPIAQFPGDRNWGYDGVFAFAAQHSYGGPDGLKRLVDAAHELDMWVFLDVVYNHLGPEGNYLPSYAPYFTETYRTPWGAALNYDDADSDHVRRYFVQSALQWLDEFRIDGFRLDAVHAIHDRSAEPFLREITTAIHSRAQHLGRSAIMIAESDLGDPRVIRPPRLGGWGMDAQWLDDFHHSLRALLANEHEGYYADFGKPAHLAAAFRGGYVYTGQHSRYRRRRHGAAGTDILPRQFVVYTQNHDQVGNRMEGDRMTTSLAPERLRLAAASVLLSPFTPMLFMGEEYGERRPFPYFISHGDPDLVEAVRKGRREEFAAFAWQGEPPDPPSEDTFRSAVLDWDARQKDGHREVLALYEALLALRASSPSIRAADALTAEMLDAGGNVAGDDTDEAVIVVRRRSRTQSSMLLLNFTQSTFRGTLHAGGGDWRVGIDTDASEFGGSGACTVEQDGPAVTTCVAPWSALLLLHDEVQ